VGEELEKEAGSSNPKARSFLIWMSVALVVVILDQVTKRAIINWIPLYDSIPINSFLNITHLRNTGAAFSILADAPGWQRWFFISLASLVSLFIAHWIWKIRGSGQTVLCAGLALVLGGALGNVIDRVLLGSVVDFIQVMIFGWPFPSFNVADSAISVGAVLLIFDSLFLAGKRE